MNPKSIHGDRSLLSGSIMVCAACVVLLLCPVASAQFTSGFEMPDYAGSAAGTDLNGQDSFYNPLPDASVTALVYTYFGNALGLPANPNGGEQFVARTGPGGGMFARSQRDIVYGNGTNTWIVSFDVAITYTGVLPAAQNIGSFSTQPLDVGNPQNAGVIALARWRDPVGATNWNADYVYWNANNAFITAQVPNMNFQNLLINHWYRWTTVFDFDDNRILALSILDLSTGESTDSLPQDWYLAGGQAGGLATPTGFRFFAGAANTPGNVVAFDNLTIAGGCDADLNNDGNIGPADLALLLGAFGPNPGNPADFDGDGVVDKIDLLFLIGNWGPC